MPADLRVSRVRPGRGRRVQAAGRRAEGELPVRRDRLQHGAGGGRAAGARPTVPLGRGRGGEPAALRLRQAAHHAHLDTHARPEGQWGGVVLRGRGAR